MSLDPADLSDDELDDIFFQMSLDANIDLLDEMIVDMKKKPTLTEEEKVKLVEMEKQLKNMFLLHLGNHYKKNDPDHYVGKETTVDYGGDLRMSKPWRSYPNDEVFVIVKKCRNGLYLLRDSKGHEHPLKKSSINYFKQ